MIAVTVYVPATAAAWEYTTSAERIRVWPPLKSSADFTTFDCTAPVGSRTSKRTSNRNASPSRWLTTPYWKSACATNPCRVNEVSAGDKFRTNP